MARPAVALLVLLAFAGGPHRAAAQDAVGDPRRQAPLTILQINDVYTTAPVDDVGGLARVATFKKRLAADGRTPWLMLAGDFLSSSVESTVFQGAQMIAALNAAGLDMATLGNHEFDFGIDVLLTRMAEAKWQWVVSNVIDRQTGLPIGGAEPYVIRTFGDLRVGFIGLCLTTSGITRDKLERITLIDPIEAAAAVLPILEAAQVDVVVALTHLTFEQDRSLATRFPEIDVIVGGHEHAPITSSVGRTLISKAGTDARFVARIDVDRPSDRAVERFFELVPMTAAIADDPGTADVVNAYASRLDAGLTVSVGTTGVPLDGETSHLRTGETNLGNLVADAVRASAGTEIALVNSGGIRGDRIYPAGAIPRRSVIEMHPFGNVVCTIEVEGRVILAALEHGLAAYPATAGAFPQVSGLTLEADAARPPGQRVRRVTVGGSPLQPDRRYALAIPDYLLLGGDGYEMFADARVVVGPESGPTIVSALEAFLRGDRPVAPSVEGRIRLGAPTTP